MKKVLVSDYDDTFHINDEDIQKNIQLINDNTDNLDFIIATGRSYYDYMLVKKRYKINSKYTIINHGASILKGRKIITNLYINDDIKNKLLDDLFLEKAEMTFACSNKKSRLDLNKNKLTKIYVEYNNINLAKKVYDQIKTKYKNYVNCFLVKCGNGIEIVNKDADKKNAILKILELENISKENVFTIGNGDTDYEMLKFFNGFKMVHSTEKIKNLKIDSLNSVSELIEKLIK